jgi:acyl-CoA synthetase (AMP-forming)/AMP-acid ligase II
MVDFTEIRDAIESIDGVEQAAVMWIETASGGQAIGACYTGSIDANPLANELEKRYPTLELPRSILHMASLPTTPEGDIDVKRLQAMMGPPPGVPRPLDP